MYNYYHGGTLNNFEVHHLECQVSIHFINLYRTKFKLTIRELQQNATDIKVDAASTRGLHLVLVLPRLSVQTKRSLALWVQ